MIHFEDTKINSIWIQEHEEDTGHPIWDILEQARNRVEATYLRTLHITEDSERVRFVEVDAGGNFMKPVFYVDVVLFLKCMQGIYKTYEFKENEFVIRSKSISVFDCEERCPEFDIVNSVEAILQSPLLDYVRKRYTRHQPATRNTPLLETLVRSDKGGFQPEPIVYFFIFDAPVIESVKIPEHMVSAVRYKLDIQYFIDKEKEAASIYEGNALTIDWVDDVPKIKSVLFDYLKKSVDPKTHLLGVEEIQSGLKNLLSTSGTFEGYEILQLYRVSYGIDVDSGIVSYQFTVVCRDRSELGYQSNRIRKHCTLNLK